MELNIKKIVYATLASFALIPGALQADEHEVNIGFLGGFTGPIESLTPVIFDGAAFAVQQVNDQGGMGDGKTLVITSGDTTCTDATAAANAADRLVNTTGVVGIVGALCSGSTISAANNAAIPGGVAMISPASTSPAITTLDDNGLVFRTAPSDAYQGQVLAKLLLAKDINEIAITYVNNDYGKGFADSLSGAYSSMGGNVAANEAHEDGKADYRAELGSLASSGADVLVVLGYADGSGQTIIRQALEGGDFSRFVGGDGMAAESLVAGIGDDAAIEGMIITLPGSAGGKGKMMYEETTAGTEFDAAGVFVANSYDAAFLLALALLKTGGTTDGISAALTEVANPPGEVIYPGEWAKARGLILEGVDVNYEGAAGGHDFDENGDVAGVFEYFVVTGGQLVNQGPIM